MSLFRRYISLFLLIAGGTLLAACGERAEERDTIRFVSLAWQEQAIDANKALIAEWNADTTHTPVEYVQGTWGSVHDFMITAFETGDVPDIFHYESIHIVDFAERGYLTDLAPMISDSMQSDILDVAWSTVRTDDGAIYGVPFLMESLVVLYNRKLFEEAGLEVPTTEAPWTWAQLREAAQQLTRDTDGDGATDQWGAAFGLRSSANMVLNLTMGFGGGYFEHEGDQVKVDVGEAEQALLATIRDMMYVDETATTAGVGKSGPSMIPGFLDGDYAMLLGIGSWARQQLVENAPEGFAWGVLPPVKAETQQQGANAQTLSIPVASAKKEEAMAFIEYFLNSQNMTRLARSDWMIPARQSSIAALASEPEEYGWQTTLAIVDNLVQGPWLGVPGLTEWKSRIANPTFQEVFSNRLSIEEAAQRIESESERILRRYQ